MYEYTFFEYFDKDTQPRKKSDKFSIPSIQSPVLNYKNGKVSIAFDKQPSYYNYIIERYDYVRHITLYNGKIIELFEDDQLEENKKYVYTITPVYKEIKGKPIILPTISTKQGDIPLPPILKDEWWKY